MRGAARALAPALVALAASCGSPPPAPAAVLTDAAGALARLTTVSLEMDFGAGLTVDEITLLRASARVRLPGDSDAVFRLRRGGLLVDLGIVSARGRRYLQLPSSPYREMTADESAEIPDPAGMLEPAGLPALLAGDRDPRYLGTSTVAGVAVDQVGVACPPALLQRLIRAQPAGEGAATIEVGRSDHLVRRVVLSGLLRDDGKRLQVELDMRDFDHPVAIATPPPG